MNRSLPGDLIVDALLVAIVRGLKQSVRFEEHKVSAVARQFTGSFRIRMPVALLQTSAVLQHASLNTETRTQRLE